MAEPGDMRVVVERLAQLGETHIIENPNVWKGIVESASHNHRLVMPVSTKIFKFDDPEVLSSEVKVWMASVAANYFYAHVEGSASGAYLIGAPYRVIGQWEKDIIKQRIYRNVPPYLKKALHRLWIPHFEMYDVYAHAKESEFLDALSQWTMGWMSSGYDSGRRINSNEKWGRTGTVFYTKGLDSPAKNAGAYILAEEFTGDYSFQEYTVKGPLFADPFCLTQLAGAGQKIKKDKLLCHEDFLETMLLKDFPLFAFSLPEEDRNSAADREMLAKLGTRLDLTACMTATYQSCPSLFTDYLGTLPAEAQVGAVRAILELPPQKRNVELDSALLDAEYRGSHPEFKWLATHSPQEFLALVEKTGEEERRSIIEAAYHLKDIPEEVSGTLSSRYPALVEEVGMHHVKEDEG